MIIFLGLFLAWFFIFLNSWIAPSFVLFFVRGPLNLYFVFLSIAPQSQFSLPLTFTTTSSAWISPLISGLRLFVNPCNNLEYFLTHLSIAHLETFILHDAARDVFEPYSMVIHRYIRIQPLLSIPLVFSFSKTHHLEWTYDHNACISLISSCLIYYICILSRGYLYFHILDICRSYPYSSKYDMDLESLKLSLLVDNIFNGEICLYGRKLTRKRLQPDFQI